MTQRGRPRLPTQLKIIRGTEKASRKNNEEPVFETTLDLLVPPERLTEKEQKVWHKYVPALVGSGVMTEADILAMEMVCHKEVEWMDALAEVKNTSAVIKMKSGYVQQNPWLTIANKAFIDLKGMLIEFGMTPSGRSRVKVTKSNARKNKFNPDRKKET